LTWEKIRFKIEFRAWEDAIRKDAIKVSREVLWEKFSEQLAPYLPGFEYDPMDACFIGAPVDFPIFSGLSKGDPKEILLLETKSRRSSLSSKQRQLRNLVEAGKSPVESP
jgi:predicted Holliday junction resolvase-like endonuclease